MIGSRVTTTQYSSKSTNQKPIYPQPRLWLQRVFTRLGTTFNVAPKQSTLPRHSLNTRTTSSPQGTHLQSPKLVHLLACIRSAQHGKTLYQDCIDNIDADRKLFSFLRQLFWNSRGRFFTLLSLR